MRQLLPCGLWLLGVRCRDGVAGGLWGIGEEMTYKQLTFNVQLPYLAAEAAMLATER